MRRAWLFGGLGAYAVTLILLVPVFHTVPFHLMFQGDSGEYGGAAIHILQDGFYSLDGIEPAMSREPGMSVFLAAVFALFGVQNAIALSLVQIVLLFLAAWYFCSELAQEKGQRIAGLTFLLILTSGSILHSVFLAYRECLALVLLLLFSGVFLRHRRAPRIFTTVLIGILFGLLILQYYTFLFFFPIFLIVLWRAERRPMYEVAIVTCITAAIVGAWGLRNMSYDGEFRIISNQRTGVMWYVRGEQAEKVQGLEPFRCLYAEYVSRDWTGLSSACSFNALMHERWPKGAEEKDDRAAIAHEGQQKILAHLPSYLWFSVVEVIELHLPFVGGGFGSIFNYLAVLGMALLYPGVMLGCSTMVRRENMLWSFLIVFNTLIFILTDATPRYLVPVFFCYALFAAIGYNRLLRYRGL